MNHRQILAYLGVESVEEVDHDRVEEELVVADTRGLVLFFEDLVVVDAEVEVSGTIPKHIH